MLFPVIMENESVVFFHVICLQYRTLQHLCSLMKPPKYELQVLKRDFCGVLTRTPHTQSMWISLPLCGIDRSHAKPVIILIFSNI